MKQKILNKLISTNFGEIVTIHAGTPAIVFHIHKDLLCHCSEYFSTVLNNDFKRDAEQTVTLEHVIPITVQAFASWLYYQDLNILHMIGDETRTNKSYFNMLSNLWLFAGQYLVTGLSGELEKELMEFHMIRDASGVCLTTGQIWSIYANSAPHSAFRKLVVWLVAQKVGAITQWLRKHLECNHEEETPEEFYLDLIECVDRMTSSGLGMDPSRLWELLATQEPDVIGDY